MSKGKYPTVEIAEMEPGEMALQIRQNMELRNLPPIDITDPEQVRQRVDDYFNFCVRNDMRPHIEGLALSIGVSRQTLWNWRQVGRERGAVIDQAVQLIASLTEAWALNGKLNPATFCFIAKNHFNQKALLTAFVKSAFLYCLPPLRSKARNPSDTKSRPYLFLIGIG